MFLVSALPLLQFLYSLRSFLFPPFLFLIFPVSCIYSKDGAYFRFLYTPEEFPASAFSISLNVSCFRFPATLKSPVFTLLKTWGLSCLLYLKILLSFPLSPFLILVLILTPIFYLFVSLFYNIFHILNQK